MQSAWQPPRQGVFPGCDGDKALLNCCVACCAHMQHFQHLMEGASNLADRPSSRETLCLHDYWQAAMTEVWSAAPQRELQHRHTWLEPAAGEQHCQN